MPEKAIPPHCFSCSKNYEDSITSLRYCICHVAVCDACINSCKKNDTTWICPNCGANNSTTTSKLIRD